MDERRVGTILVAIGLVAVGIGVVGFVTDRGAAGATSGSAASPSATLTAGGASPAATPTPAATATATPVATPTPVPTATPDAETRIRSFYGVFVPAVRAGDAETLLALLHPVAIERYGEAGCRASFGQLTDATYEVVIKTVHDPAPWDYARDDRSTTIPDAWAIDVDVTNDGATTAAVFHLAPVDGEIRWFADCGTPLPSPAP